MVLGSQGFNGAGQLSGLPSRAWAHRRIVEKESRDEIRRTNLSVHTFSLGHVDVPDGTSTSEAAMRAMVGCVGVDIRDINNRLEGRR